MHGVEARRREIARQVRLRRTVSVRELGDEFGVTPETIRTDLVHLDNQGLVRRVHGGVIAGPAGESAYQARALEHKKEKKAIAEAAAKLYKDEQNVYLDYGTTVLALARRIALSDRKISACTVSVPIVKALLPADNVELIVLGGHVRRNEASLSGPMTAHALERMYFDVGFFSCAGFSVGEGITNYHDQESEITGLAMSHCKRVVMMIDHSKIGSVASLRTATLSDVTDVVTDGALTEETAQALREASCKLHIAKG